MSVGMSAVLAGISEVLIKYTGNVWLQIHFKSNSLVLNKLTTIVLICYCK